MFSGRSSLGDLGVRIGLFCLGLYFWMGIDVFARFSGPENGYGDVLSYPLLYNTETLVFQEINSICDVGM